MDLNVHNDCDLRKVYVVQTVAQVNDNNIRYIVHTGTVDIQYKPLLFITIGFLIRSIITLSIAEKSLIWQEFNC